MIHICLLLVELKEVMQKNKEEYNYCKKNAKPSMKNKKNLFTRIANYLQHKNLRNMNIIIVFFFPIILAHVC